MQGRRLSAIEAVTNVAAGYAISLALTATVLPLFGYDVTGAHAVGISLVFTVASVSRSYVIRRLFNRLES